MSAAAAAGLESGSCVAAAAPAGQECTGVGHWTITWMESVHFGRKDSRMTGTLVRGRQGFAVLVCS